MKELIITPWGRCFLCEEQTDSSMAETSEFPLDTICQFLDIRLDGLLKLSRENVEVLEHGRNISVRLCEKCSPNTSKLNQVIEEYEKTQTTLQSQLDWLRESLARTVKVSDTHNGMNLPLVDTFRKTALDKCAQKLEILSGKISSPRPEVPSPELIRVQEPRTTPVIVSPHREPEPILSEIQQQVQNNLCQLSDEHSVIVKIEYETESGQPLAPQEPAAHITDISQNTAYHSPPLPVNVPVTLAQPPMEPSILPHLDHHHVQPFIKTEESLEYINLQPAVPYVPVTQYQYHGYYSGSTPPYQSNAYHVAPYGFQPWQPSNVPYYPPALPFPAAAETQWQPQEQTYSPNSMTSFDEPQVTAALPSKPMSIPEQFSENSSEMQDDSDVLPPAKQMKLINSKTKTCPFCKKTLANRVTTHISRKHPEHHFKKLESTPMPQFAKYCDQVLKRHMDISKARDGEHFLCVHCRKRYNYSTDLRVHLCQHHVDVINEELHKLQT